MKILIACEESQTVVKEFRKLGHEAFSCDIEICSGGYYEWHIHGDVIPLLNGDCMFNTADGRIYKINGKWDMIIAFPPCTHLSASGARYFEGKRADGRQEEAIRFFAKILNADCDRIAIENPVGIISGKYLLKHFPNLAENLGLPIKYNQIIHPWMFGDNYSKATCLWLKGLPTLIPYVTEKPEMEYDEWIDKKTGEVKRQSKWMKKAWDLNPKERAKFRSKTFIGIARAMANQWGCLDG